MSMSPKNQTQTAALRQYFEEVWDSVLIPLCGAKAGDMRDSFLFTRLEDPFPGNQYRFQGNLGFGGKLYTRSDLLCSVDCYPEDKTPARIFALVTANRALRELWQRHIGNPAG